MAIDLLTDVSRLRRVAFNTNRISPSLSEDSGQVTGRLRGSNPHVLQGHCTHYDTTTRTERVVLSWPKYATIYIFRSYISKKMRAMPQTSILVRATAPHRIPYSEAARFAFGRNTAHGDVVHEPDLEISGLSTKKVNRSSVHF